MRGFTIAEMQPDAVEQGFLALLDRVYRTGETYFGDELPLDIAQPDGRSSRRVYFNFTYQPYRQNGEVVGISVFAYDVTMQARARQQIQHLNEELAAINEELAATNEELQASNEELGTTNNRLTRTNADLDTFVYTASHDLKAPITNIEGLLQALLGELPATVRPGDVNLILDLIQGSIDRFKTTIGHLTDVSRLQQVHGQPATQVALAEVVHAVRLDLNPLIAETQARLEVDVTSCPIISFSAKNLRSIVYNLLSNALKYRHPNRRPQVRIYCRQEPDYYVLLIQDNGLGIAEAQQQRVFNLFQRFHTHVEGSGIGLYMVKKMVENAGGYILVESEIGQGTTFSVFFPR
jgi:signal transduction histidine kinase